MQNNYSLDSYMIAVTGSGQILGYDYQNSGWCREVEKIFEERRRCQGIRSINKIYDKISVEVRRKGQGLKFLIVNSKCVFWTSLLICWLSTHSAFKDQAKSCSSHFLGFKIHLLESPVLLPLHACFGFIITNLNWSLDVARYWSLFPYSPVWLLLSFYSSFKYKTLPPPSTFQIKAPLSNFVKKLRQSEEKFHRLQLADIHTYHFLHPLHISVHLGELCSPY